MIEILYNAIKHNMEFGQAYYKDFLKRNPKKFILFILNFRNSNLNEFDLTKILKKEKGYCLFGPKLAMGFNHEFNIICLFLIYIIYCYETKLILPGYARPKIMRIFMDLRDVMGGGGNISKI
jgi:uncharacterized membrane protein